MALQCWAEPTTASDPTRYKKSFYKRFVWAGYQDYGPSTPVEIGGHIVDPLNNLNDRAGLYSFGQAYIFQTPASLNALAGAGYNVGTPSGSFWTRATHYFFGPIQFAAAWVLRSDTPLTNTDFLVQLGDTQYNPGTVTTHAGSAANGGGNAIGMYYQAPGQAFQAFNRGPAAANIVITDMGFSPSQDIPYVSYFSFSGNQIQFGIYDTSGNLLSKAITQNLASDFKLNLPLLATPGHTLSDPSALSYPKIYIQTTDTNAKSFGLFWYYFEDSYTTVPETFSIGV